MFWRVFLVIKLFVYGDENAFRTQDTLECNDSTNCFEQVFAVLDEQPELLILKKVLQQTIGWQMQKEASAMGSIQWPRNWSFLIKIFVMSRGNSLAVDSISRPRYQSFGRYFHFLKKLDFCFSQMMSPPSDLCFMPFFCLCYAPWFPCHVTPSIFYIFINEFHK